MRKPWRSQGTWISKSEECYRKPADHLAWRQSDKEDAVARVKTELSDMEDHKKPVQEDIARRAYALYEADDFKDGLDLDHWFRAARELTVPDVPLSVEQDALTVRIAMEQFSGSPLVISVSHRSLLILGVTGEPTATSCASFHSPSTS